MFLAYFSSSTHLNRWGQMVFTTMLSKEIAVETERMGNK
jgi:hypothetical protein